MRRFLLALCLPIALALAPAAAPAEPVAPRDRAVPEGTEGLSGEEIYWRALEAAEAGDSLRYERLLAAAADKGDRFAGQDLVRLHYLRGAPDWRETALRYLRPIPRDPLVDEQHLYWLAAAGERREPPLPQAQTDLWYRIAAWSSTDLLWPNRADLQTKLARAEERWLLGGEISWRYRELVGEALRLRRADGARLYAASRTVCDAPLEDAELLCMQYLEAAADKDHAKAQFAYASRVLDAPPYTHHDTVIVWAVGLLCRAGQSGIAEATIRLAQAVLELEVAPSRFRLQAYLQLEALGEPPADLGGLQDLLRMSLTNEQLKWLADMAAWGRSAPGC